MSFLNLLVLLTLPGVWLYSALDDKTREGLGYDEKWAIVLGASFAVTTLLTVTASILNIYSFNYFVGFYILLYGVFLYRYRKRILPFFKQSLQTLKAARLTLLTGVLLALVFGLLYFQPTEYFFGGRDPGVYVNTSLQISENETIKRHDPLLEEVREEYPHVFEDTYHKYAGIYVENRDGQTLINPQFYHAYSIWLSISHRLFGMDWFLMITPLMALISLFMFFVCVREMFNRWVGLISTLLLGLNISQIWYARSPYTEILSQLLIWFSIYILIKAFRRHDRMLGIIAGLALSAAILVRLDNIFILPAVALFFVYVFLTGPTKTLQWARYAVVAFFAGFLVFIFYVQVFAREYTHYQLIRNIFLPDSLTLGALLLLVSGVGLFIILACYLLRKPLRRAIALVQTHRRWIAVLMGILVAGCFAYLYFIRPMTTDPHLMSTGIRSYREETLLRLGWYVMRAGLLLFLVGIVYFLQTRFGGEHLLLLLIAATNFALYLYDPKIFPDHFWAVRRHVPFIIPTFIVFISYAIYLPGRIRLRFLKPWMVPAVLTLYFCTRFIMAAYPYLHYTEFEGARQGLDQLAERFEDRDIIITNDRFYVSRTIGTPLDFIYDQRVLVLREDFDPQTLQSFVQDKQQENNRILLMIGTPYQDLMSPYTGYRFLEEVDFEYMAAEVTDQYRPMASHPRATRLNLYEVTAENEYKDTGIIRLGAPEDIHLRLEGFYDAETHGDHTFRWASGNPRITTYLPAHGKAAEEFRVTLSAQHFLPAAILEQPVKVYVNGEYLTDLTMTNEREQYKFVFPGTLVGEDAQLEIAFETFTWTPDELGYGADHRELGIAISDLVIQPLE